MSQASTTPIRVVWMAEIKPDLGSRLIMRWQKAPYSHVAIVFRNRSNKEIIWHAIGRGVCFDPLDAYLSKSKIVFEKHVELECSYDFLMGLMAGEEGKEYSDSQLVAIVLLSNPKTFIGCWMRGLKLFVNNDARRICSEAVGILLHRYSKFKLEGEQDYWTPSYLHQVLRPDEVKHD